METIKDVLEKIDDELNQIISNADKFDMSEDENFLSTDGLVGRNPVTGETFRSFGPCKGR